METPAGLFRNFDYKGLSERQVKAIDNLLGHSPSLRLANILDTLLSTGAVGSARLAFGDQPTATDTVTIGADVYEFVAHGGQVAADTNIAVEIGATVIDTAGNFASAINNHVDTEIGPSEITLGDGVTPALAFGTESVMADQDITDVIRIRNAGSPGGGQNASQGIAGVPLPGTQSIALAETLTPGASIWNQANLNATGTEPLNRRAEGFIVIDATNLINDFTVELPFTPTLVNWHAVDVNNAGKATTAIVSPASGGLLVNANAGASPLVATDRIHWQAFGAIQV